MFARHARVGSSAFRWFLAATTVLLVSSAPARAEVIFAHGFECGSTLSWSATTGLSGGAHACGPGHLVLVGHDYESVVIEGPERPQGAPPTPVERLLINAVAQSHAEPLAGDLRVRILDVDAAPGEVDAIETILDAALDVQFQTVGLAALEGPLFGLDVLLVPDQQGAFEGETGEEIGEAARGALHSFLVEGGVVVVLEGTYDTGDGDEESETFRVLDPELLAIEGSSDDTVACSTAPCNDDDPLLDGIASPVCPGSVTFATDEPWWTLAKETLEGEERAFALHRWFGPMESGPVALQVENAWDVDLSGFDAFFQDVEGGLVAECKTLENGTAVHQMDPGGFASLGSAVESNHLLYTFVGVEPPDRLLLAQSQPPDPLFEVTAILPESVVDAAQYRVDAGCGAQATSSEFAELPVAIRCLGPSGTYSLIVEALDVNGEILAYTMKNGLTGDADVEMPAWKEPNLSASLSPGLLTGVERVDLEIGLSMTTVDFVEGLGAVKRDGDAGEFSFYSDPGSGVPAFSLLTHSEGAEFAIDGTFRPRSERTVRGGLTTSLDVALSSVLLPRLDFTAIDLAETGAVTVSWTAAGSLPGVDGGRTILSWINSEFGTNLWQLVFPPGSSVTSPPEPGGTFTGPYWPFDEAEVTMSLVELLEASYLPSYAAFRADFTAPPPAGLAYTSRRTSLEYEFVPE